MFLSVFKHSSPAGLCRQFLTFIINLHLSSLECLVLFGVIHYQTSLLSLLWLRLLFGLLRQDIIISFNAIHHHHPSLLRSTSVADVSKRHREVKRWHKIKPLLMTRMFREVKRNFSESTNRNDVINQSGVLNADIHLGLSLGLTKRGVWNKLQRGDKTALRRQVEGVWRKREGKLWTLFFNHGDRRLVFSTRVQFRLHLVSH